MENLTDEEKRAMMSKARDICQREGWTDSGDVGMCLSFNTGGNYHKWRKELALSDVAAKYNEVIEGLKEYAIKD